MKKNNKCRAEEFVDLVEDVASKRPTIEAKLKLNNNKKDTYNFEAYVCDDGRLFVRRSNCKGKAKDLFRLESLSLDEMKLIIPFLERYYG